MSYFVTYTGNGSLTDFPVTFPFIARSHVSVTVNGTPVAFTWLSDALIRVSPAPANASTIRIERYTPREVLVTWQDGASLKAADLTKDTQQAVFVAAETSGRADEAKAAANNAVTTANNALTTANNALTTANNALAAVTGAGNVPAPTALQVTYVLEATGVGAFAWRPKQTLSDLGGASQAALNTTNANLSALAVDVATQGASLAALGSLFNAREVATTGSLVGGGTLSTNRILSLANDSATPGGSRYYGTNSAGVKGWFALPAPPDLSPYVTNGANVGTGSDVFLSKAGSNLQFRRVRVVNASTGEGSVLIDATLSVATSGNDLVITLTRAYGGGGGGEP